MSSAATLGIVGLGEVGYYTAKGLKEAGVSAISAYNAGQRNRPPYSAEFRAAAEAIGVELVDTLEELTQRSEAILCATTPATTLDVAKEIASHLTPAHIYVDINSCGPAIKIEASELVAPSGARFVDACLLASPIVSLQTGMTYLSGAGAVEFKERFAPYGMDLEVIENGKVGDAALLKMLRSIITKGRMSILWELCYTAHKCGIDLRQYERAVDVLGGDFFAAADRTVGHGYIHVRRRADEAREMQETLRTYGVDPFLAEAYERRFMWAGRWESELREHFGRGPSPSATEMIEAIDRLERLGPEALREGREGAAR